MKKIKVKTPAKINLTLEVLNKREDGFHNIQSIMQTISLYDYLDFEIFPCENLKIELNGTSKDIPYNENNLVYKAAINFFKKTGIKKYKLKVNIEKNIPVSAGLAGGSSNAAGTFFALNKLFNNPLNINEINVLCSELGSDINFCMNGGCALCSSRGEIINPLPVYMQNVSVIKYRGLGISAKEAYTKFSELKDKSNPNNTEKLKELLLNGKFDNSLMYNSLEKALLPIYKELAVIKNGIKNSLMTGSGSAFFVLNDTIENDFFNTQYYEIYENLSTIKNGVCETI